MKCARVSLIVIAALAAPAVAADPTWTVINDTTSVTTPSTRSLRSIALESDGGSGFYTGFIQGSSSATLRRHDSTGAVLTTLSTGSSAVNSLTTDDRGNVYMGTVGSFRIYDSALANAPTSLGTASLNNEGMDIARVGASYFLYTARGNGTIARYDVTNPAAPTLDSSWGTAGVFTVPGAGTLRGLDVAADGTIFVTQRDATSPDRNGTVYRLDRSVTPDSPIVTSASITGAMDVVEKGGSLYVTEYNGTASEISVLNATTLALLDEYDTNLPSRGNLEGYAALDISASGQLYLVDQIYGGPGNAAGTQDRVLRSSVVPEPTTLAAVAAGALVLLGRRRRKA